MNGAFFGIPEVRNYRTFPHLGIPEIISIVNCKISRIFFIYLMSDKFGYSSKKLLLDVEALVKLISWAKMAEKKMFCCSL